MPSINADAMSGLLSAVSMPITAYGQPAKFRPVVLADNLGSPVCLRIWLIPVAE